MPRLPILEGKVATLHVSVDLLLYPKPPRTTLANPPTNLPAPAGRQRGARTPETQGI